MKQISNIPSIKKIVLESRVSDITVDKLSALRDVTKKQLEIAVGIESANPTVRALCVNKYFDSKYFEDMVERARQYDIQLIALLILKPPFLTEAESINDFFYSDRKSVV